MNYYETLYIVHPALESGRLKDIILDVENNLKTSGGSVLATEFWGKRKLAYLIDKQKYGTYILIQYSVDNKFTQSFSMELEHNPNILAYLTTSINENEIIEDCADIDEQIAGKTRELEQATKASDDSEIKEPDKGSNDGEIKEPDKASDDSEIQEPDKGSDDNAVEITEGAPSENQKNINSQENIATSLDINKESSEPEIESDDSTNNETSENSSVISEKE